MVNLAEIIGKSKGRVHLFEVSVLLVSTAQGQIYIYVQSLIF